jgi:hypothetical protein
VHGSSISVVSQQVAKAWKRRHIRLIQTEDDVGLGGLIYPDHVTKLLRKKDYQMFEGNVCMGQHSEPISDSAAKIAAASIGKTAPMKEAPSLKLPQPKKPKSSRKVVIKKEMTEAELRILSYTDRRQILSKLGIPYGKSNNGMMLEQIKTFLESVKEGYVLEFEYLPK